MKHKQLFLRTLMVAASAMVLSACGGGGSSTATDDGVKLTGTVAKGRAIEGATVIIKDANGLSDSGTTDKNGNYTIAVKSIDIKTRLIAQAKKGEEVYYSMVESGASGVVNITTFSDTMARTTDKGLPEAVFASPKAKLPDVNFAKIQEAQKKALQALQEKKLLPSGVSVDTDPTTTKFVASTPDTGSPDSTGIDAMLDCLKWVDGTLYIRATVSCVKDPSPAINTNANGFELVKPVAGGAATVTPVASLPQPPEKIPTVNTLTVQQFVENLKADKAIIDAKQSILTAASNFSTLIDLSKDGIEKLNNRSNRGYCTGTTSPLTCSSSGLTVVVTKTAENTFKVEQKVGETTYTSTWKDVRNDAGETTSSSLVGQLAPIFEGGGVTNVNAAFSDNNTMSFPALSMSATTSDGAAVRIVGDGLTATKSKATANGIVTQRESMSGTLTVTLGTNVYKIAVTEFNKEETFNNERYYQPLVRKFRSVATYTGPNSLLTISASDDKTNTYHDTYGYRIGVTGGSTLTIVSGNIKYVSTTTYVQNGNDSKVNKLYNKDNDEIGTVEGNVVKLKDGTTAGWIN